MVRPAVPLSPRTTPTRPILEPRRDKSLATTSIKSLLVRAAPALMLAAHLFGGNLVMAKQAVDVEHQVEQAFRAAREGEFGHISQLPALGPRVVPLLAPYLHDDQADIRRESEGRFQVDRQPPL